MISVSQAEARAHPLSGPLGCLVLTAIARYIIYHAGRQWSHGSDVRTPEKLFVLVSSIMLATNACSQAMASACVHVATCYDEATCYDDVWHFV